MTDSQKQTSDQIWSTIQESKKVLLSFHPRPDADSVGANLAMYLFLNKLGKDITVISGDDDKPQSLSFLPGWENVENKNIGEVRFGDFDLFISIDAGGIGRVSTKNILKTPLPIKTVVIDHHSDNQGFGNLNLIDPNAHSSCELLWELFEDWNKDFLDSDIATNIYSGAWSDTLGFVSATRRTYEVASKCLETGINSVEIYGKLTKLDYRLIRVMGNIFSGSNLIFNKKVLLSSANLQDFEKFGIRKDEIGDCKEATLFQLMHCREASIIVFIYEYESNRVSISLRTDLTDKFNMSTIAKIIGGGGHPYAASAKIDGTVVEAEKLLKDTIQKVYPDLEK